MILSLRLKPGVAQVEQDLASALVEVGQLDRAIEHFKQALAIDPELVQARLNLAGVLSRHERPAAAAEELERARAVAPDDPLVLFRLGRARSAVCDWDGATEAFEACLDSDATELRVLRDVLDGQSYGITGTPTFFINGQRLVGARPFDIFRTMIDAALEN